MLIQILNIQKGDYIGDDTTQTVYMFNLGN